MHCVQKDTTGVIIIIVSEISSIQRPLFSAPAKTQEKRLDELNQLANEKLQKIRSDTSRKLDAYSSRQKDPFYQLVTLDSDLEETRDAYILKLNIPDYEQKHLSITVRGNQIVVSGSRRNEEKLEVEPGRQQSTASYQSYQETFPISWPVDSHALTRKIEGDTIVVTIPKKGTYSAPVAARSARDVELARADRPHFPENIPHTENSEPIPESTPKKRMSTLS